MGIRWRIALLLAVITTINYIDRSVFGVVAPVVREQFGIGDADYGLITSGFLFAYGLGQLISGPIIDRLGTKRAFSLAAIFWSLATIMHALGRGLWSFLRCAWFWESPKPPIFQRPARRWRSGFPPENVRRRLPFLCWVRGWGPLSRRR